MGGVLGACHGLDVPLVFGNLDRGLPAMLIGDGPNPEAEALSAHMRAAWTAFAAHGDPGWTAYDTEQRLVQLFDSPPTVAAYPEETSRLIWQDHTFPALPLDRPIAPAERPRTRETGPEGPAPIVWMWWAILDSNQ